MAGDAPRHDDRSVNSDKMVDLVRGVTCGRTGTGHRPAPLLAAARRMPDWVTAAHAAFGQAPHAAGEPVEINAGVLVYLVLKSGLSDQIAETVMSVKSNRNKKPIRLGVRHWAETDPFHVALRLMADRVGAVVEDESGTNISAFKTNYSTVLDRAKGGSVEVVTRGPHRFVILGEETVQALVAAPDRQRTVSEACVGLPTLSFSTKRPRSTSVNTRRHTRIPR